MKTNIRSVLALCALLGLPVPGFAGGPPDGDKAAKPLSQTAAKPAAKPAAAPAAKASADGSKEVADAYNVVFKTQGKFSDVRDNVAMAIEGKGLKITHSNFIAAMLDRTGADLGLTSKIYENAEQMEFCSATVSRDMMKADPHAIVLCPYSLAVYQMPNDKNVYIAFRKPPAAKDPETRRALAEVEKLLRAIVKDAL
ncbi:MAG: DUF302 domain-containing protein [Thiobacillus sp.]|nr:DUF302 domain-containing protein [Thiobacillus sp.]